MQPPPSERRIYASVPQAVADAVGFIEEVAAAAGVPEGVQDRLSLAVSEAVSNAVEHGNRHDSANRVGVGWRWNERSAWVYVEDDGKALTTNRIASSSLPADPMATGGRGLFIISKLADAAYVEEGVLVMRFDAD